MRLGPRGASGIVGLAVLAAAACSTRNLDLGNLGNGKLGAGGGDAGPGATPDAGPPDGPDRDGPPGSSDAGGIIRLDAAESHCVTVAVPLPWRKTPQTSLRLAVVTSSDAIAVMRLGAQLDVRTYRRDGTAIGGFQFEADAQLLPYLDGRFLLLARGTTGDFVATSIGGALTDGTRLYTATATATEHMLRAIVLPTNVILLTDENFVSFAAGGGLPWYRILGVADTATFKSGRIFGLAAQSDSVLVAWGSDMVFRLAVVGSDGSLVARADQAGFFGPFGSQTATAMAYGGGLLMFDGNPVRLTQIGFDLSRQPLGQNDQLLTFDETSAQIAPITLLGDPIAFWLTVFPGIDASQSATTHQLYGCALDRGDPKSCASTALIAATGLGGPGIGDEPVAAAALPDDSAFALAHTDVYGQSWLRIANMSCAQTSVP